MTACCCMLAMGVFSEFVQAGLKFFYWLFCYVMLIGLNMLTLPVWLVSWLICYIFDLPTPGIKIWKAVCYPSWDKVSSRNSSKKDTLIVNQRVSAMSGVEFEHYCARLLKQNGMSCITVTPRSGDYGADIVAVDSNGVKWVFQCKRYNSRLGNTPIQEVVGSMAHYGAQRAGVMTNSTFTDSARQLALDNNVFLWELIG